MRHILSFSLLTLVVLSCTNDYPAYEHLQRVMGESQGALTDIAGMDANIHTCNRVISALTDFLSKRPDNRYTDNVLGALKQWTKIKGGYEAQLDSTCRVFQSKLFEAYQRQSIQLLDDFVEHWRSDLSLLPLQEGELVTRAEKAVYDVFLAYADSNYRDIGPFLFLPNKMAYMIVDTIFRDHPTVEFKDTIWNFRPPFTKGKSPIWYLDHAHDLAMREFVHEGADYERRFEFLEKRIAYAPAGVGFSFLSLPIVSLIALSHNLDEAEVYFRDSSFTGGSAIFRRTANGWVYASHGIVWIS